MQFDDRTLGQEDSESKRGKASGYLPNNIKFHSALNSRRERAPINMRPKVLNFDEAAMDIEKPATAMQIERMPATGVFAGLGKSMFRQDSIFDEQPEDKGGLFGTAKKSTRPVRPYQATGKTKNTKKIGGRTQLTQLFADINLDEYSGNFGKGLLERSDSNVVTPTPTGKKKDLVFHRFMNQDEALFSGKFSNKRRIDLDNRFQVQPLGKNQSASKQILIVGLRESFISGSGKNLNDFNKAISFQSREDDPSLTPSFLKKSSANNDFQFRRPLAKSSVYEFSNSEAPFEQETIRKKSSFHNSSMAIEELNFDIELSNKKKPSFMFNDDNDPTVTEFVAGTDFFTESPNNVSTPKNQSELRGNVYLTLDARLRRIDFDATDSDKLDSSKDEHFQISRFDNDFETVETLGAGNFGKVIKCRNKLDKSMYAVKITSRSLKSNPLINHRGHIDFRNQRGFGTSFSERRARKSVYRQIL